LLGDTVVALSRSEANEPVRAVLQPAELYVPLLDSTLAAEADALDMLKELGHSDQSLEIDDEDPVRDTAREEIKAELEQRHGDIWILGWDRACKAFGDWEAEHVAIPV
jgi:hypothetical protein